MPIKGKVPSMKGQGWFVNLRRRTRGWLVAASTRPDTRLRILLWFIGSLDLQVYNFHGLKNADRNPLSCPPGTKLGGESCQPILPGEAQGCCRGLVCHCAQSGGNTRPDAQYVGGQATMDTLLYIEPSRLEKQSTFLSLQVVLSGTVRSRWEEGRGTVGKAHSECAHCTYSLSVRTGR
ncbi:uncharacterized protein BO97DRAFT_109572 [Aspergillus homomorphus CBS 101889]|uniref:Uncharacterized protein n=1 Tax=Aspergillus homomorphus (strain CBS 101889) TaxID=1450537 RepID=A0A395HT28_ASPHC|nr:hypothetical protein BO97DRAFT_109572 [Aspergillus homomorphus CBS 101889]RAL10987.1 hypothetical protein BO97DRAFT_109572 [Aspergillus homomorphus CBS 101889]